jgi:hypothetical protein
MAELKTTDSSLEMGMHTEQLSGRTQQVFFSSEEGDNFTYPWADQVDFDKSTEIDVKVSRPRRLISRSETRWGKDMGRLLS